MITVYLAGPITGQDEAGAKNWHQEFAKSLYTPGVLGSEIKLISPLRCEPKTNGRYDVPGNGQETDLRFGTPRAIAAKNEADVRRCDVIVAYFPFIHISKGGQGASNPNKLSVGTIVEASWAKMLNKPLIVVSENKAITHHPLIKHCAGWMVHNFDDAADIISGVFKDYA